jgi:sugar/nucleoside kinase (ribokinase family)
VEIALGFSVLAVGDANVDIVLTGLKAIPQAEQDTLAQGFEILIGGQACTFARALSRLGVRVAFVGKVGEDAYGRKVIAQLHQDGVDTSGVIQDPGLQTGVTVVLSTGSERAFATYLGSISELRRTDIRSSQMQSANHIHVGSYFLQTNLQPELANLFREAHESGMSTSLDPGWNSFGKWEKDIFEVLNLVDVFLPNEVEAAYITQTATPEEALDVLGEYAQSVVIKRGSKGCLAKNKKRVVTSPAFDVPVVDTTSAGDIFNAGFIYAFLNKWELDSAARFANACGAIAVTKVGSSGILSSFQEVEEFLASETRERKKN